MKIEAGKYYKTRDGRKVGPIRERDGIVSYGYLGMECDGYIWEADTGKNYPNRLGNSCYPEMDLIAEWTEEQIGTLPELDVKPGDVVENISHERYKGLQWTCYDKHPNGYSDQPCAVYSKDGQSGYIYVHNRDEYKFRLISRATPSIDLTAIREPFGLLDKATQDAMIAHGGPYELWDGEWGDVVRPKWRVIATYRVKPGPKRETVTKDAFLGENGMIMKILGDYPVTITYDTIDGVIDMATYRVVAK